MDLLAKQIDERLNCRGVVTFVGPFTAWIGDVLYQTLTSYGWKEEGEPIPRAGGDRLTEKQAIDAFTRQIDKVTNTSAQVAWRRFPALEQMDDGGWVVTCRLAPLGRRVKAKAA